MSTREERKSKGIYGKCKENAMQLVNKAVRENKMGFLKASKEFNVLKTILRRHFHDQNKIVKYGRKHIGRTPDLPKVLEKQLADHVFQMKAKFYGLTLEDLKKLAIEIASANGLATRFKQEKGLAGTKWLNNYLKRQPEISLRTSQPTSLARASGFNKTQIHAFYNLLEEVIFQNSITPDRLFNMDESGLSVEQKVSKVLAKKERYQIGAVTSQERGQTITLICSMSAAGYFISPGMIFPRK